VHKSVGVLIMFKIVLVTSILASVAVAGVVMDHAQQQKAAIERADLERASAAARLQEAAAAEEAKSPPAPTCADDWHVCRDNAEIANTISLYMTQARSDCQEAINAHAKYGEPKWRGFWSGGAFHQYVPGSVTGTIKLGDKDVQMQNGFGAWQHMQAFCVYDLNTKSVVSSFAEPVQ
jgi:hypothetical protein